MKLHLFCSIEYSEKVRYELELRKLKKSQCPAWVTFIDVYSQRTLFPLLVKEICHLCHPLCLYERFNCLSTWNYVWKVWTLQSFVFATFTFCSFRIAKNEEKKRLEQKTPVSPFILQLMVGGGGLLDVFYLHNHWTCVIKQCTDPTFNLSTTVFRYI